jgi:drug/metabolite transporter (DMT)-like permease
LLAMNSRQTGILYGLIASAIWGGMYVISKVVLEVIPPFTLLSLRLLLGAATLGAWVAWRKGFPRLSRKEWLKLLSVGLLGYGVSLGFQLTGTKLSTAANGSVITAATPAFVYLFAWILLKEKVTRRRLFALLVSTGGVLAVIDPTQAQINSQLWLGNLLLVGAAVTWALYSVLVRHATRTIDTLPFTLIAFIGGMLLAFPATAWELNAEPIGAISFPLLAGVLYLGIVSMAISAYLWNRAFKLLEAGVASLTFFAQPIVGAGLGALFLNEQLTSLFIAGTALIMIGLWLAARDDRILHNPQRS